MTEKTAIEKAQERNRKLKEAGMKVFIHKTPIEKAKEDPRSLRKAITAKCWDCEGDEDPAVKWRIGNCLVPECPLYPVRPFQNLHGKPVPRSLEWKAEEAMVDK